MYIRLNCKLPKQNTFTHYDILLNKLTAWQTMGGKKEMIYIPCYSWELTLAFDRTDEQ